MESVIKIDPPAELKDKDGDAAVEGVAPVPGAPPPRTTPSAPAPSEPAPEADGGGETRPSREPANPDARARASRPTSRPPSRRPRRRRRPRTARPPPRAAPPRPPNVALAQRARRHRVAQPRRPRLRHRAEAGRAEAPRQLRRLRDPDPRARDQLDRRPVRPAAARCVIGPRTRSEPLSSSSIPSACVSLPGPEQRSSRRSSPRRARMQIQTLERLERADQHRRADPLVLVRPR